MMMRAMGLGGNATWTEPHLSGDPLQTPVAATYRAEDDSYYVLDTTDRSAVQLLRIDRTLRGTVVGKWQLGSSIKRFGLTTGNEGSLVISASTGTRAQMGTIRFSGTTAAGDLVFRDLPGMGGQLNQAAYLMSGRIGLVLDFADGTRDMKGFLASQGVTTTLDGLGVLFQ